MSPFSFSTIKRFDDHIQKSIPGYELLNKMVVALAHYFVEPGTNVYDIGCSTGNLLYILDKELEKIDVRLFGLEREYNFTRGHAGNERLSFIHMDVRKGFKFTDASLVFSIFTLQFLPRSERLSLLRSIYSGMQVGGAFVLAEKVYSENTLVQEIMTFLYYDFKRKNFSGEEILDKEQDLRMMLRPNTLSQNISLLHEAGFSIVEVIWRCYNFLALLCVKG